jgi:zinc and cadmium transporter
MLLIWIIVFSLLGSVGSILTASGFLLIHEKTQELLIPALISFASGTLLAAALLGLIPHALEHLNSTETLQTVLIGIILFFFLEKIVIWRHCHDSQCDKHATLGPLILIGDAFHNAADGVIIAASFLYSIPIGILTAISVIAHEIPQEVGDFAILLHSGYSKKKALILNLASSLSTVPTAVLAYLMLDFMREVIPYVMALSAASFIYIALADLYPELHQGGGLAVEARQFLLMIAGIVTIMILLQFPH